MAEKKYADGRAGLPNRSFGNNLNLLWEEREINGSCPSLGGSTDRQTCPRGKDSPANDCRAEFGAWATRGRP
jgi:hypothetical protein